MRKLVKKGTFGFGVFQCNDLTATYLELNKKGRHKNAARFKIQYPMKNHE
jgi:hypothetical protein